MAFDEQLADRIRAVTRARSDIEERKMFGGLAFLVRGHMCCGIVGSDLMVRVGPDGFEDALAEAHVRPMDFTGRPSKGMVYVAPPGIRTASALRKWIERGIRFSETLPARKASPRRTKKQSIRSGPDGP
jgi:TfoX/Sxy family transcriptional regulator of competence genes